MIMQEVYLFNPDNDLALANGDENYMPPLSARKMADDLSLLPVWYASTGAFIMSKENVDEVWLNNLKNTFSLSFQIIREEEIASFSSTKLFPWGWNATLIKHARLLGFSDEYLPGKERMENIRELSHRSQAAKLLKELTDSSVFCGSSEILTTDKAVREFVERYPRVLLKAPWSGSGKGLRPGKGEYTSHIEGWSRRIIKYQRCVIGEPFMEKVEDFAMEFFCDEIGRVSFVGYSFFETDVRGAYKGNLLASDKNIEAHLAKYVSKSDLLILRKLLEEKLTQLFDGKYQGYLGVDMMVCHFSESPIYRIHPCVEINLRMNMGLFSRLFHDRFVQPHREGHFEVEYFKSPALLLEDHLRKLVELPLVIEKGRILSGYLSLNPIDSETNYRASIVVEK